MAQRVEALEMPRQPELNPTSAALADDTPLTPPELPGGEPDGQAEATVVMGAMAQPRRAGGEATSAKHIQAEAERIVQGIVYGAGSHPEARSNHRRSRSDAEDSIRTFLDEVGRYPLLNKDSEVSLANLMREGQAACSQLDGFRGSVENRRKLQLAAVTGDVAKDWFMNTNLRLVVSIAKKYQGQGLELGDLIQEGILGLERAVGKFDPDKGFKFSTYGTWWIRQAVTRSIANHGRSIRLPVHAADDLKKFRKTRESLILELGRPPTPEEIADDLGEPLDWAAEMERLEGLEPLSLDEPVRNADGGRGAALGSLAAPDVERLDVTGTVEASLLAAAVAKHLAMLLDDTERAAVILRFGLKDGKQHALRAIKKELGLKYPGDVVRILEGALTKLRTSDNVDSLKALLDE